MIQNEFTEPQHPQQNPAESRAIRWLISNIRTLCTRTGAPEKVWFWTDKYLVDVHNITADETIGWITPWSKRRRETPDISAFLQFRFYETVYYLDPDEKFKSTKEKTRYWLGVSEYVGEKLCFYILTTGTKRVIERCLYTVTNGHNRTTHWFFYVMNLALPFLSWQIIFWKNLMTLTLRTGRTMHRTKHRLPVIRTDRQAIRVPRRLIMCLRKGVDATDDLEHVLDIICVIDRSVIKLLG
jgi:hypothetical protein